MAYFYFYHVRAVSPEAAPRICVAYRHTLTLVQEPGWVSGSCMINQSDPNSVLIYEVWGSLPPLQAWLASEAFQRMLQAIAPFVTGPAREETFQDNF